MLNCRIIYGAFRIIIDYRPGCANFSYWLYRKISENRWHRKNEIDIWLTCDNATEEEAEYVEKLAIAQWGKGECEVVGRPPVASLKMEKSNESVEVAKIKVKEEEQLSLF